MSASSVGAAAGFALNPFQAVWAGLGAVAGGIKDTLDAGADARKAQDKLESQRRQDLANEAAAREVAKKKAETTGQRVGMRTSLLDSMGFGGASSTPGLGAGSLFGN